ncbi:hypothetical protein GC089_07190 [Cellulomonas sp. JZ18]|uniref:hypothetical protein n=1 Tax=Cellulomonas sp. JZ18 TaxID=2654191 RepID=UPI0012D457B9|nr:hypothetical protein [Cellulomonas sp. JZ18]QGQ19054.1 hypothetical protein GC089_07190 [Cellulomonas sp. JZ18]
MTRSRSTAIVALTALLALAGCAGRAGAGEAATRDEIARWSEPAGIAPELVHVTTVDGFDLATQSVGVSGGDGMAAAWVGTGTGGVGTVLLRADRYPDASAVPCADLPDSSEPVLRCSLTRGDVHVVLEGEGVEAAVLRAAADAVRVPGADELAHLFSEVQVAGPPVERGDLPPHGDGAPGDAPGAGG